MPNNQSKESTPTYYLTDFPEILALTNKEGKRNGEIAITLITPTQTIHALLGPNQKDSHEFLIGEVCKDIFGDVKDVSNYCVEVRHIINSADEHYAYPTIPKIITNSEFDRLSEIIEGLIKKDTYVLSMTTNINPTKIKNAPQKREEEFEGKDILKHLIENDRVHEYDLPFEEHKLDVPQKEEKHI